MPNLCLDCGKPLDGRGARCRTCAAVHNNKQRAKPPEQRFWEHVRKGRGCWTWTGYVNGLYGRMGLTSRKSMYAHRFSYELHYGPIPDGLFVCHKCDNPLCVNPAHLFLGTHQDNMDDRNTKGRQAHGDKSRPKNPSRGEQHHSKTRPWTVNRGERVGSARLTVTDVYAIRELIRQGVRKVRIAERFGVDPSTIADIAARRTWTHI